MVTFSYVYLHDGKKTNKNQIKSVFNIPNNRYRFVKRYDRRFRRVDRYRCTLESPPILAYAEVGTLVPCNFLLFPFVQL